jgi:hypothetical protein
LADKVGLTGEYFDPLLLAETEFTQAIGDFRRGGKLLDADDRASLDPAQGTNLGSGTTALENLECRRRFLFHCDEIRAIETWLQEGIAGKGRTKKPESRSCYSGGLGDGEPPSAAIAPQSRCN